MIVTRRPPEEFAAAGYVLVAVPDVAEYERAGVPLYLGRSAHGPGGPPSGPYAPGWAVELVEELVEPFDSYLGGLSRSFVAKVVRAALLDDDPEGFAQAASATARLGGAAALAALLQETR